jgi:aminotransferase
MNHRFAARIRGLVQSEIRRMSRESDAVGGINLGQGICDQPVENPIKAAASAAVRDDRSSYSPFEGITELRRRIADKMASYNGISCDPDSEVLVTVGSTGGFVIACLSLLDPGDEVILFSPFYGYHKNILDLCGATTRFVETRPPHWEFDEKELAAAFGRRTKAVVINTPANPSGKVFRKHELDLIGKLCEQYGVLAITDEIYEYILYDDAEHLSIGAVPGMEDRTITLSGFSKTYSMTGWRLGYVICNESLASRLGVVNDLLYICAPTPLQHGVLAAFDLTPEYYRNLRADYARKLGWILETCRDIGMQPFEPQGAYYLLTDLGQLPFATDVDAAAGLLNRAGVAGVPGSAFYAAPEAGSRQLRLCFAKQDEDLQEACRRLREAFG